MWNRRTVLRTSAAALLPVSAVPLSATACGTAKPAVQPENSFAIRGARVFDGNG